MMVRIAALAVAATVGMLVAVPVASADASMYLDQMRQKNKLFVELTNDQLIRLGNVVCQTLQSSVSSGQSLGSARGQADQAVASTATGVLGLSSIDRASVMNITQGAEGYLC